MINIDDSYTILDKYFEQEHILYQHQHKSFDQFLEEYIPNFLMKTDHVFSEQYTKDEIIRNKFSFSDVRIKPPVLDGGESLMFPVDARINGLTYSASVYAKIKQMQEIVNINDNTSVTNIIGTQTENSLIAKIPMMVKSKYCNLTLNKNHEKAKIECEHDHGGIFIVNGSEKLVTSLEKMKPNHPYIFSKKEQNTKILVATIQSQNYATGSNVQIFNVKMKKDGMLELNISQFQPCSIFVLLRAMGMDSDKDIVDWIVGNDADIDMINQIRLCMESVKKGKDKSTKIIVSEEDAQLYMMNKMKTSRKYSEVSPEIKLKQKTAHLLKIMTQDILPHMGTDLITKARYICNIINKLLSCFLKKTKIDDRDSFINKRIELPGPLLALLFQQNFKITMTDCRKQFDTRSNKDFSNPPNIIANIKTNLIEQGIRQSLSRGRWGNSKNKSGVAQTVNRLSYIVYITSLRKIVSPGIDSSTNKLTSPRHFHATQDGMLCPVEIPEGAKTGLVKTLALTGSVTLMSDEQVIILKEFLEKYVKALKIIKAFEAKKYVKIFLNDEWLGVSLNPIDLIKEFKEKRYSGLIEKTTSISFSPLNKEIHIYCDGGRLYRPLFTVSNGQLNLKKEMIPEIKKMDSWNAVLIKYPHIIDYVDIEELCCSMLALYPKDVEENYQIMNKTKFPIDSKINRYGDNIYLNYTHCEIHPSMKLGVAASIIPFSNHNQAPRNLYQYAQIKQALGMYSTGYLHRVDISNILFYNQIPIVTTRATKYTGQDVMTAGENIIVAIASYTGYNQEDAIVFNQSAIDRGLFRAMIIKKEKDEITSNQTTSQHDVFMKPTKEQVSGMKGNDYSKLNTKGYVPENTIIEPGDAIIGKCTPNVVVNGTSKSLPYKDVSKFCKEKIPGMISKVYDDLKNNEGYDQLLMRIFYERIPVMGDKFASRAGQKGTIGITYRQEDMPMTADGLVPDIIINPNCMPGRMTIGQIIEMIYSKVAVIEGLEGDATPFNFTNIEVLKDRLEKLGFERNGKEKMYNGFTGEEMETEIFIAPAYYQRLKHMVHDKIHSRSHGQKQLLTRQPSEGRTREGGLRLGEMERDSLIAHGVSLFLKERLVDCSDSYSCYVCGTCGFFASRLKNNDVYHCQPCNNTTDISRVIIPYAFKLLVQELAAMNIAARIRVKKDIIDN